MSELYSENLNRFNGIIESLPLKLRLNISSLCLLDNVATQMLRLLLLNSTSPQVIEVISDPTAYLSSGETEMFQTLLKLFTHIRMIYDSKTPLLTVHDVVPGLWFPNCPAPLILRGHEAYIVTAIRKSNLLTFLLTILNCFNYGFELLQESFLDVFCPNTIFTGNTTIDQNGKFLKSQAILYLELKTQAFISALKSFENGSDRIPTAKQQEFLDIFFSNNLSDQLVLRRRGNRHNITEEIMTPSQREFVERCERRRENLLNYTSFKNLIQDYDWNHFVKELLDYCNKNLGLIIWGHKGKGKSPLYCFDITEFDTQVLYASGAAASDENVALVNTNANTSGGVHQNLLGGDPGSGSFDSPDLASTVTQQVMLSAGGGVDGGSSSHDKDAIKDVHGNRLTKSLADAAVAVTSSSQLGHPITGAGTTAGGGGGRGGMLKKLNSKRTWSREEQDALAEGLRDVGPSWAKILDLYGPGGKINESLKNRSQVQLKDKARNWKLQYLKTGRPLPEYLLKVTGTLERTFRSKKKIGSSATSPAAAAAAAAAASSVGGGNHERESSAASELFGPSATDTSGFDPNLEANI
ncbi:hypothetical protein ZYGR_0S01710 [Zygosaccharomyces rouxii]|uniref:ZYRO0F06292p n=2 Tax=Zygosaccharomyces rouxii TaxID=4956 RepID=C5DXM7_ZYGRC|nr:uncharacterized protein ZYRO0F06292g [Zygosaccharomyces rouxii]KAH9199298.1 telomere repeat binding factor-domain-containing protein [Zygosaccharomyces rouxii]GAV50037.1 hypothetical protein ZYGR_0S01710 [Zygosaccharomyces rouxii]CAR28538.1 ZYRO0F06292p [Zygosaccharomyces rouxii]